MAARNGDLVAVRCSPIIEVDDGPATFDDFSGLIEEFRFARDSPLEEIGFELVVPCRAASRQGPTNCPAIIIAVDDRNYLQT